MYYDHNGKLVKDTVRIPTIVLLTLFIYQLSRVFFSVICTIEVANLGIPFVSESLR